MAYTSEEKEFVEKLSETYPNKTFKVTFKNGYCGLEDMSFPSWTVTILDGVDDFGSPMKTKVFHDKIRYGRSFGDTAFHNDKRHYDEVFAWVDEVLAQGK